ncbi:hypothetical protein [Engelhardtia mirabilis]|uniref:Uncharacterized protein n=1 Tax=Engelhardtia mirabilis TaxID=2528011 RepID=A0A518BPK7_9BACT|nr:hypothetical protein Pla133_40250 [Planctomycetes bacterium Pla133]QDV03237.1 hypothetical protein Pla86_40240 [Planctomycetes bacterium Pla86]
MDTTDDVPRRPPPPDGDPGRVTSGGPVKSERLRARPIPQSHQRRSARPLNVLAGRTPGPVRVRRAGRMRRLVAALAIATVLSASLLARHLDLAWTLLLIGAGLGALATIVPFTVVPAVERRQDEPDGALVRVGLDVAPMALALVPGLILLPSLRQSLLALPALGFAIAAAGLWRRASWATWTWRGCCGALMGWSALFGLRAMPGIVGPADAGDWFGSAGSLLEALSVAAIGWWVASRLETALAHADVQSVSR